MYKRDSRLPYTAGERQLVIESNMHIINLSKREDEINDFSGYSQGTNIKSNLTRNVRACPFFFLYFIFFPCFIFIIISF